jgi:ubiquinone/menaquinone biosynthesis C-methylase UbiE
VEPVAYRQFRDLEKTHWWFIGRRRIFTGLLARGAYRPKPGTVLDLGCGAGEMLEPLTDFGEVVALDYSKVALDFCRERGARSTVGGDAMRLPFRDGVATLAALVDAIEHLPDDEAALREAHRVLAPGGTLLVTVPAYEILYSDNDRVAHHLRRYTARELAAKVERAGFERVWTTYYNTTLLPLIATFLLGVKAKQALWPSPPEAKRDNLHVPFPALLHRALAKLLELEGRVAERVRLPFGHSIVCLAVRA